MTPDATVHGEDEGLSDPERKLLAAAGTGRFLVLRAGSVELNEELHDPAAGPLWTDDQTIRAEVLADLLTGKRQPGGRPPGYIMLRGARITGSLDLMGVSLACPLWLQDCYIDQPVNLNEAIAPAIRLPGCRVLLLAASQLRTAGDLVLDDKFTAEEEILLQGARIGGSLSLSGAKIASLDGDRLTVEGTMSLRGTSAHGEVRLTGAHIGGQLNLAGARLAVPGGIALAAERLNVTGDMYCTGGFRAEGEVQLSGAHIVGQFVLDRASLANPGGRALHADRLIVDDSLYCGPGFNTEGEISLLGARIGGQLSLDGATLTNTGGRALSAEALSVSEHMFCRNGFRADGEVRLLNTQIGGVLDLSDASLANPGGTALHMELAQAATLIMMPSQCPDGSVILINARVGSFVDSPQTWPTVLALDGFVYDRLGNTAASVEQRLEWLRRSEDGYMPQIYNQLVTVYRRAGREEEARAVAIAKQRRRRTVLNPAARLVNRIADATVGYGYRTWKAAVWLAVLASLSTFAFSRIHMVAGVPHPPVFNPLGYSLDLLLPIADLGQKSDWQASGGYQYLTWVLQGIGWVLTTAVVAAVTGVLKRD